MPTEYPNAVDSTDTLPAADGVGTYLGDFEHSAMHGNTNDAIRAIETELGVAPSDSYATVKARLDAMPVRYGCTLTATSGAIPDGGGTLITWLTEVADTNGFITAPGTTVTIPTGFGGVYLVSVAVDVDHADLDRILLIVDGLELLAPVYNLTATITFTRPLAAGDTITVTAFNAGAGTHNIVNAELSVYRVSK